MLRLGGRMCALSALLSVLLAGLAAASSDLFDDQLGDINYCKKQCALTIRNKSPAKVSCPRQAPSRCGAQRRLTGEPELTITRSERV